MPGQPGASISASVTRQRARDQQAVLDRLRAGQGITGAKPANPIIGGIQALFGGAGAGAIPTLNAARLGGQEVLMNRGGWDSRVAGSGPINVGGQTWYPAQSGQDLVYKRAPGNVGGQYGSILSKDQSLPPEAPLLPPVERAYETEKSRIAQLTAQDPELQRYEAARLKAVAPGATPEQVQSAEDIGMQMWAKANPTLAAKVKPGQAGYDAIQRTLAGNMARAGQGFGLSEQLVPTPQGFPTQVPGLPTGAGYSTGFGVTQNLAPGAQTPPPYSTLKPGSELSGLGAAPLGTASTSPFGQPDVMSPEQFEKLLKLVKQ